MSVSQIQLQTAMWMNLKNNVKLKKQDTREYILFDSICINSPKEAKHMKKVKLKHEEVMPSRSRLLGAGGRGLDRGPREGHRLCSGWMRGGHGCVCFIVMFYSVHLCFVHFPVFMYIS